MSSHSITVESNHTEARAALIIFIGDYYIFEVNRQSNLVYQTSLFILITDFSFRGIVVHTTMSLPTHVPS